MAIATIESGTVLNAPGRTTVAPRPALRLVTADDPRPPGRRGQQASGARLSRAGRLRLLVAVAATALLLLLAVPVAALGGRTVGGSSVGGGDPTTALPVTTQAGLGTFYVVRPRDTLRSIAARVDPGHVQATEARLASELGSGVVVPGEHVRLG